MSHPGLLQHLKEHALGLGYRLLIEDTHRGTAYLPPEEFEVIGADGTVYRVHVERVTGREGIGG